MPYQNPNPENVFIIVISIIAMFVFGTMLIAAFAVQRSKVGKITQYESGSTDDSPALNAPPSASSPFLREKRAWLTRIAILGTLLVVLLLVEFALQFSLNTGWKTYTDHDGVGALTVDPQGHVWSTVYDIHENGVSIASIISYTAEGEPTQILLPDELSGVSLPDGSSDSVLSLTVDQLGQVWVRTVNGLIAIRDADGQWTLFGRKDIEDPLVAEIVIDGQGQAWTNSGELARIELDSGTNTYTLVSSGIKNVDTIAIDKKGQLWVFSANGDLKMLASDGNWVRYARAHKADPDTEWAFTPFGHARLAVDKQGQVWIGVGNGIVHVLGLDGVWQTYRPDEPNPTIYTERIVIDDQGYMWGVTGYQGLYRFHPSTGWTPYNPRNSGLPPTYSATTLATDGQGRLWIGTFNGGLVRFDPDAALPVKYVPILSILGAMVVPAALLSTALVMVWAIAFTRPGAITDQTTRKFWTIALGSFGAAMGGLHALGQREMLADQLMQAVFGEGWGFADALVMLVAPALSICLIPLLAIVGAAIGVLLVRLYRRALHN